MNDDIRLWGLQAAWRFSPKSSGDVDGGSAGGEVELVAVDLKEPVILSSGPVIPPYVVSFAFSVPL